MERLDPSLAQVGDHPIHILLGHAERDVVLRRLPVHDGVHSEEPEHPLRASIAVDEQRARPASPAETQRESELPHVEVECAIDVRYRQVDLVEAVVEAYRR